MRLGREGFALLTALWLVLALSVLIGTAAAPVIMAIRASENRVLLVRAQWAALGCLDLVRARFANGEAMPMDSVSLGGVVWCTTESLAPERRVNPNLTDSVGLSRMTGDPVAVASLLDWIDADSEPRAGGAEDAWYLSLRRPGPRNGPVVHPAELRLIRGIEQVSVEDLERYFTVDGTGRVSANRAPAWALSSVSTLDDAEIARLVERRDPERPLAAAEQLTILIGKEPTIEEFRDLGLRFSFSESSHVLRFRGFVNAGARTVESQVVATLGERDSELTITALDAQ